MTGDVARGCTGGVFHLVHERHTARKQEHGEPAHVVIVVKVRHQNIGGLKLVRARKLLSKELRDIEREVNELTLTK